MSMNIVVYGGEPKVKSKGDIRLDRMWSRWRERNTQAAATVVLRERHIKELEQQVAAGKQAPAPAQAAAPAPAQALAPAP